MLPENIYHRGTTLRRLDAEIFCEAFQIYETTYFYDPRFIEVFGENDYAWVSMGFMNAIESLIEGNELEFGEWHHYFTPDGDGGFDCKKFQFA